MAANSKQDSILARRENYQGLEVILEIQFGINICLGLR
jgi:hypothetical protein